MNAALKYIAALLLSSTACQGLAHAADLPVNPDIVQKLEQRLDDMQQQLAATKQQIQQLKAQNEALSSAQQQQTVAQQQAEAQQPDAQAQSTQVARISDAARPATGGISANLSLWGYGEIYYTHPTHIQTDTQFDLARGIRHWLSV